MTLPQTDSPSSATDAPHGGPEADLARYETYSPSAVIALVLGIVSTAVLFHPLMFVAVVLAVGAALYALYEIEHDGSATRGRWMAIAALSIAIGCGAFVIARQTSRGSVLKSEAIEVATAWIALIQKGEVEQAHQFSLPHRQRQPIGTDLKKMYAGSHENKRMLEQFYSYGPIGKVRAIPQGELVYQQTVAIDRGEEGEAVDQIYELRYDRGGQPATLPLRIVLERSLLPGTLDGRWRVVSVTDPQGR